MLPSILCRALHSALPPWKCISCKLPLPSLHIFLDHVRGSHKVFLEIPFADPQVVDHNHRQHCNSLIFVTGDKPTASWASPGPSGGVVQPFIHRHNSQPEIGVTFVLLSVHPTHPLLSFVQYTLLYYWSHVSMTPSTDILLSFQLPNIIIAK